jgi:class 3 adenylate cyclase
LEPGAEAEIQLSGQEFPAITVTDQDVFAGEPSASGAIEMRNAGSKRRTIVIEDRTWLNDVLTAARVTTLQAFRDLFSEQVLRPGDDVSITNITFMFTDLVNSTSLFERVGDAGAYRVMREHFALLERLVREHDGGIVKTTGDGVHGAFNAPENALRAAVAMQRAITSANASGDKEYFQMRIGLHTGSSISVTLNERLDYYGSTVNIAARLEGEGAGGQITMSQAFVSDIAVQSMLSQLEVKERVVELKGIAGPVFIFLITPGL